jgi:hypothetical protein
VAANPIDSTWRPGLCDDGDADLLVANTMSPESLIGVSVLRIFCLFASTVVVWRRAQGREAWVRVGFGTRAPPSVTVMSVWRWSTVLVPRRFFSMLRYPREAVPGKEEPSPSEGERGRQQESPVAQHYSFGNEKALHE